MILISNMMNGMFSVRLKQIERNTATLWMWNRYAVLRLFFTILRFAMDVEPLCGSPFVLYDSSFCHRYAVV